MKKTQNFTVLANGLLVIHEIFGAGDRIQFLYIEHNAIIPLITNLHLHLFVKLYNEHNLYIKFKIILESISCNRYTTELLHKYGK